MNIFTDINHQELKIGDNIMYIKHNKTNTSLCKGNVIGFTTEFVKIQYFKGCGSCVTSVNTRVSPSNLIKYII